MQNACDSHGYLFLLLSCQKQVTWTSEMQINVLLSLQSLQIKWYSPIKDTKVQKLMSSLIYLREDEPTFIHLFWFVPLLPN